MFKKILIILTIIFLCIGAVSAGDNDTETADGQDGTDIVKPCENTWSEVQNSIDNANENSIIELNCTYYGKGERINVEKPLTFQGKSNATFDAQSQSGIFWLNNTDVTFQNVNFINGFCNDTLYGQKGGIIISNQSSVTFINCSFFNNRAEDCGSVINVYNDYDRNSSISIVDSVFANNSAGTSGGVLYSYSGSKVSVINSIFINNSAEQDGGALYVSYGSNLTLINSIFTDNSGYGGGAIYASDYKNILICNSLFTNNSANDDGGAVLTRYTSYNSIVNSTFINNSAEDGGALCTDCYRALFSNSTFLNNHARGLGGALYNYGTLIESDNSTFINNSAQGSGGAVCLFSNRVFIKKSDFINNSARYYAGACMIYEWEFGGNFTIINSTFISNSALYSGAIDVTFEKYLDPGFMISEDTSSIANCVFKYNSAAEGCGCVDALCNLNISDTRFEGNYGEDASSLKMYCGESIIKNCSFSNNVTGNIIFRIYKNYEDIPLQEKFHINDTVYSKNVLLNDDLIPISLFKISADKVSMFYRESKYFKIKLTNKNSKKPAEKFLILTIGSKSYNISTNSKGIASFKIPNLNVGIYSVVISSNDKRNSFLYEKTYSTITIKAKTIVKAPKVTNKYKKSKYFKVTLKYKATKKVITGIKIKIKVYTGKKYKTYTVKTNKKGVAQINTKKLKKGSHRVVISSGNSYYIISAKSTIRIK